jgi:hypothetical protein
MERKDDKLTNNYIKCNKLKIKSKEKELGKGYSESGVELSGRPNLGGRLRWALVFVDLLHRSPHLLFAKNE